MLKRSIILALLIGWFSAPALWARVWTDRQGRQTDAQFVRLKGESVVLQKGLKPLVIPLKEFCDEDQEYIKELTKGKGGTKSASGAKSEDTSKDDALPSAFKPKNEKTAATEKSASNEKSAVDDDPFLSDEENAAKPKAAVKPKPAAQSTPATKSKSEANPDSESNPFLADDEKSTPDEAKDKEDADKTPLKPKGEKPEVPQINTEGGFDERTWTDVKGNKLTANFSRLEGKIVILLNKGVEQRVALDQFTYNDKLYIRQAMVELQKYQKFAGNRAKPTPQDAVAAQQAQAPTPTPTPFSAPRMASHPPPSMPSHPVNPMFQALQQQAEAQRQAAEARRQQAEAQRQERLDRMVAQAEQNADKMDELFEQGHAGNLEAQIRIQQSMAQQRAESEQRLQEARQRMGIPMAPTPGMPSFRPNHGPISPNTNNSSNSFENASPETKIAIGGVVIMVAVLGLVLFLAITIFILRMIFGQEMPNAKTRGLNSLEVIMCFALPGLLFIAGLVWTVQGYNKGKSALIFSGVMILLQMIVTVIVIATQSF